MNIILCGLPMSGKTTIGKLLADKLKWHFADTDRLIENGYAAKTGKELSCRQIFVEEGDLFFRQLEKQQIASLKGLSGNIIAVGGGSLCNEENIRMLQLAGDLVYLKAPVKKLWERIQWRGVPAYLDPRDPEKAFLELAEKRMPLYEAAAKHIVETDGLSEEGVVATICLWKNKIVPVPVPETTSDLLNAKAQRRKE